MKLLSSSSCHAISADFPHPLSPPLPIVHCFRKVFRYTSRIGVVCRFELVVLPFLLHVKGSTGVHHIWDCSYFSKPKSLSSSSSYHAISTDIPNPLSPLLLIVHCFRLDLKATPSISAELLYVGSSWSSCLCSSMWRGPLEYITYELAPTSPAVSRMSGSSNFDSFRDGW